LPQLQAWAEQARAVHDAFVEQLDCALGVLGERPPHWRSLPDVLLSAERRLAQEQAALARLKRFAAVLGVAV